MTPPARQGSFTNTAIWTCTLLAIAGLTVWKFEIWPITGVATNTGRLDSQPVAAESIAVAPITIAAPNTLEKPAPAVERIDRAAEEAPPPPTLAKLDLAGMLPPIPEPEAADWSRTPPPGEATGTSDGQTLDVVPPKRLPTGADFGGAGLFPEAKQPPAMPAGPVQPLPTAEPKLQPVSQESDAGPEPGNPFIEPVAATAAAKPTTPETTAETDPRFAAIDAEIAANRYLAAHRALSKLYWDEPNLRPRLQKRIDQTAGSIYFDPLPHYMPAHQVAPGGKLSEIAALYHVPTEYLARLNDIDVSVDLESGQPLKVIKGPFGAVIDLGEQTLTLHAHGYYVRAFPCEISTTETITPGEFHVLSEEEERIRLDDGHGQPGSLSIQTADSTTADPPPPGTICLAQPDAAIAGDLLAPGSEVSIRE